MGGFGRVVGMHIERQHTRSGLRVDMQHTFTQGTGQRSVGDDEDFTFFGKAYFEDGLRKTDSFIEAFNIASPLIAERDAKEGYEAALPMMNVGTGIRAALNQYTAEQKQLAWQRSAPTRAEAGPEAQVKQLPLRCASCE